MNAADVARLVLETLQRAWNAADGAAYGAQFTDDADFVDIRGELHRGRAAIGGGHQWIFDNVYKGSHMRYSLVDARAITPDVVVAHGVGVLETPSGMFDGRHAIHTLVLTRDGEAWRIAAFHNALADAGTAVPHPR